MDETKNTAQNPEEQEHLSFGQNLYEWAESLIMAVVWVVLIFIFIGRLAGVNGESMVPTLHDQDWLVVNVMGKNYDRGDIVVVLKPTSRNEPLIKRVIAVGGDTIDIDFNSGTVKLNNKIIDEPYIFEQTYDHFDMTFPQTVPEGHVFVMGDNRNNSWDSRVMEVGMVDERYVLGKAIFRLLPMSDIGGLYGEVEEEPPSYIVA